MSSPPHSLSHSFHSGLKAIIPLSEDHAIFTHGQNLPTLLQNIGPLPIRRNSSFLFDLGEDVEVQRRPGERELRTSFDARAFDENRPAYERRASEHAAKTLMTPQMRSQRLIGNSNPRYRWEQYYKTEEELKRMRKPIREYYARNNSLIQQYLYIDCLLDSSLPHSLIQEYQQPFSRIASRVNIPDTIQETHATPPMPITGSMNPDSKTISRANSVANMNSNGDVKSRKVERTPKNLYRIPGATENTSLLSAESTDGGGEQQVMPFWYPEDDADSIDRNVTLAIYINLAANTALLVMKIIVTIMTSSVSVMASLVDAALDFLSTAIVWTTTRLIAQKDQYNYPVGRRRLEPIGVLVFSVIMITSYVSFKYKAFDHSALYMISGRDFVRTLVECKKGGEGLTGWPADIVLMLFAFRRTFSDNV